MTAHRVEQRMNDTNTDSDGPNRIQTATGGDKPQTAGGTPQPRPNPKPESKTPWGVALVGG